MNLKKYSTKLTTLGIVSVLSVGLCACGKSAAPPADTESADNAQPKIYTAKMISDSNATDTPVENTPPAEDSSMEESSESVSSDTTIDTDNEISEETTVENPILGHYEGNIYENSFFGFGCDLNDTDWVYTPQDELLAYDDHLKNWLTETDPGKFEDAFPDDEVYTLLHANCQNDFGSMQISLQKMTQPAFISEKDYLDTVIDTLPLYLDTIDCHDFEYKYITETIMGEEHPAILTSFSLGNNPQRFHQVEFVILKDGYAASCSIGTVDDPEKPVDLLDVFFAVPQE